MGWCVRARTVCPIADNEGDPDSERWVRDRVRAVLKGQADSVALAIRRKAVRERLDRATRAAIDECAAYLVRKRAFLDYPTTLDDAGGDRPPAIECGALSHRGQRRRPEMPSLPQRLTLRVPSCTVGSNTGARGRIGPLCSTSAGGSQVAGSPPPSA